MEARTPEKDAVNESFTYSISVLEAFTTNTRQNKQEPSSNSPQLLKQLSSRVKQLIKDKQHQGAHQHGEDIMILKKSNAELQSVIDQLKSKTSTYKSQYSPYTEVKDNQSLLKSNQKIKDSGIKQSNRRQVKEVQELSPTNASFKKEVMYAINYAIQAYQEKMCRQQKYISELERRLAKLQQIQKKIDTLRFQKQVKLQASPKKVKNFSLRTAQVVGDLIEQPQVDDQDREIHFFENPHKKSEQIEFGSNSSKTLREYALLQEQNAILQQRLDIQIENRAKQTFDRQSLLKAMEQLQKENKNLKKQLNDLQDRLKFNQQKYSDLQIFLKNHKSRISGKILPNLGSTLMNELLSIVNELKICGIERYKQFERQINEILIERGNLRTEITALQQAIINGCKFSCTHRQVFNLKEKIASLQQKNREYQYQLRQSEPYSRINREQEQINAKTQFQFQKRKEQIDYLKWPRLAYFCMLTSIARLQDIVRQPKSVLKS